MKNLFLLLFLFYLAGIDNSLLATTFYIDPATGNINNSGDKANPWDTLEQVFRQRKAIAPGDTLFLLSGHHGAPIVRGNHTDVVLIAALPGHVPTCSNISFSSASNWQVKGLTISPETSGSYSKVTLIKINENASDILVEDSFAYSVLDHSTWSQSDWSQNSCTGISIEGDHNIIRNCRFLNVKHGILVETTAEHNLIDGNVVENFAADGMRGIGSYNTFQYNTVKNCYDVDDNHDDGFQSYSYSSDGVGKTTVYGIVLRGNTIINFTDPQQKFRGSLQGFGCFDGMFEDWVIENNVIIVDHWHGISLYGAKNCRIINNTVIDQNDSDPGPPWIKITAHKNGTKSTGNIVQNNLTASLSNDANIGQVDHNMTVSFANYKNFFTDWLNFDLSLIAGSRPIDRGTEEHAPATDIIGTPRPQGDAVDLGAYEYISDTGVSIGQIKAPSQFELSNSPNPFNPHTVIAYTLPHRSFVELSIYSIRGRRLSTLVKRTQDAGRHQIGFTADGLPSGLYLCRISTENEKHVHKMILQK